MRITSNELGSQAYQIVKEMIISQELKPGQKIIQDKLAEDLGISRTPLRSALEKLESESFVESLPRRGMIVKALSSKEIIEIYECRKALEGTAAQLISQQSDVKSFVKGAKSLFAPFQGLDNVSEKAYQEADLAFHQLIIENCGNGWLSKIFSQGNLLTHIDHIGLVRPATETLKEHNDIIEAIASNKASLAKKLMYEHLEKSQELVQNQISNE